MATSPPDLRTLIDFPSTFVFRVMAEASEGLVASCEDAVAEALGRRASGVELRESSAGRYLAVRLSAEVRSPEEIYAVYAALRQVPGVRLIL